MPETDRADVVELKGIASYNRRQTGTKTRGMKKAAAEIADCGEKKVRLMSHRTKLPGGDNPDDDNNNNNNNNTNNNKNDDYNHCALKLPCR
jgi:hypothetical protein